MNGYADCVNTWNYNHRQIDNLNPLAIRGYSTREE
jgi:hypothetical protein